MGKGKKGRKGKQKADRREATWDEQQIKRQIDKRKEN